MFSGLESSHAIETMTTLWQKAKDEDDLFNGMLSAHDIRKLKIRVLNEKIQVFLNGSKQDLLNADRAILISALKNLQSVFPQDETGESVETLSRIQDILRTCTPSPKISPLSPFGQIAAPINQVPPISSKKVEKADENKEGLDEVSESELREQYIQELALSAETALQNQQPLSPEIASFFLRASLNDQQSFWDATDQLYEKSELLNLIISSLHPEQPLFYFPEIAKDEHVELLMQRKLAQLQFLQLSTCRQITDRSLQAIASNPCMKALQTLLLFHTAVTDSGVKTIADSEYMCNLHLLDIGKTATSDKSLQVISNSKYMANLQFLLAYHIAVTDVGVMAVANSEYMSNLREFDLAETQISDQGFQAIGASEKMANLRKLSVSHTKITDDGVHAIAASPFMKNLHTLNLDHTLVKDQGAQEIANSETMANLCKLNLSYTGVTNLGIQEIAESSFMKNLKQLRLFKTRITHVGLQALKTSLHTKKTQVLS